MAINRAIRDFLVEQHGASPHATDETLKYVAKMLIDEGKLTVAELREIAGKATGGTTGPSIDDILGGTGGHPQVVVLKASDRYNRSRPAVMHKSLNRPVEFVGQPIVGPSQLQLAKIGAWFKHFQRSNAAKLAGWGMAVPDPNEHEQQLLKEMYHEDLWTGSVGGDKWVNGRRIGEIKLDVKTLLNDATSGGTNLVPFDFDSAVVTYPLLHSEIMPFIDLRDTVRDEVQTATIANATATWNTPEGTEMPLFNTDSLIGNITATVFPVSVCVLYGRDLEADTPIALGNILVETIGNVLRKELDDVVCNGDGTTQPEGLFVKSGVTDVPADSAGGAPTVDDYLSLAFAVEKQYRTAGWNPSYVANDTSYQRARSIPVDSSTDARLVHGMDVSSYSLFNWPYRIQNDIANTKIGFFCLKKYRLWRRSGFTFEITGEGADLLRRNEKLLVARARYAGELLDPAAGAIIDDAQA